MRKGFRYKISSLLVDYSMDEEYSDRVISIGEYRYPRLEAHFFITT